MEPVKYHTSPYEKLGYRNIRDIQIIRKHLNIPFLYQKIIFKNFKTDLTQVPILLPKLINKIHDKLWSDLLKTEEIEFLHKMYNVAGVPPQFNQVDALPNGKRDQMKLFHYVTESIVKFVHSGNTLYIHSDNETNALLASAQIVKSAVKNKIPAFMVPFCNYIDVLLNDKTSDVIKKVVNNNLVCLYFVGAEYSSDWSDAQLKLIISQRQAAGLSTIICSSKDPEDFFKRYKFNAPGVVVRYDDEKITKTINMLLMELEGK